MGCAGQVFSTHLPFLFPRVISQVLGGYTVRTGVDPWDLEREGMTSPTEGGAWTGPGSGE